MEIGTNPKEDFAFINENKDDPFYHGKYVAIHRGLPICCNESREEVRVEMAKKHPLLRYMIHYFYPPPPPRRVMAEPHFKVVELDSLIEVNERERERVHFSDGKVYVYLPCGDWESPESFVIGTYSNGDELKKVISNYYRKIADTIDAHNLDKDKYDY